MIEFWGAKKTEWDFVGKRRIAFVFSGIMVATGFVAAIQIARGKAPMGIDFAGGLSMTIALEQPVEVDRIRQALSAKGVKEAQIQQLQSEKGQRLLIKLRAMEEESTVKAVINDLAAGVKPVPPAPGAGKASARPVPPAPGAGKASARPVPPAPGAGKAGTTAATPATGNTIVVEGTQAVGPAVGKLLQQKAAWAAFWSIIMITIYIWWRFEYRFGVAAAIATAHDVFAVMGIMYLLNKDFTLLTVSALLTIAGYSLTDTVVVYGRIRENMRLRARDSLEGVINISVNEVLSRTTMTSMTTLMPLVALLIYGSQVTYDFALALTMGIFIGTYSSWYVASPIIVEWENYNRRRSMEAAAARQLKRK